MSEEDNQKPPATTDDVLGTKTGQPHTQKITRSLKHEFSASELKDLAEVMANKNVELTQKELERKKINSALKAEEDEVRATINSASNKYSNGYEYRDIDCVVKFHKPTTGMKTIIRKDTFEVVEEVKMTAQECQELLPLDSQ